MSIAISQTIYTRYSLPITLYSLPFTPDPLHILRYPLLFTLYSFYFTHYTLLFTPNPHPLPSPTVSLPCLLPYFYLFAAFFLPFCSLLKVARREQHERKMRGGNKEARDVDELMSGGGEQERRTLECRWSIKTCFWSIKFGRCKKSIYFCCEKLKRRENKPPQNTTKRSMTEV